MERRIGSGNPATCYVYDSMDRLAAVLPPMLLEQFAAGSTYSGSSGLFRKYACLYLYDKRGNCTGKKLPGAEWQYILHDAADRAVLYQDGNLRAQGKWRFVLHDKLGREVLTGTCTGSHPLFNNALNAYVYAEWKGTSASSTQYLGYDITGVTLTDASVETARFYDSHDYQTINALGAAYGFTAQSGYGTAYTESLQGLLTGSMARSTSGTPLYRAFHYDDRGNVVQEKTQNLLGGMETVSFLYDFRNKPLKRKHDHTATGKPSYSEVYTYTYDHGERLTGVLHRLTANDTELPQVTLSSKEYDEAGRMVKDCLHGQESLAVSYGYNIRSWLTSVAGNSLDMQLQYEYSDGTPRYNGDISCLVWKAGSDTENREYRFSYDDQDRLVEANYSGTGDYDAFYSYDRNGNITELERYGGSLIDDLTYTYSGNQLTKVEDASGNTAGFKDGASTSNEYTYDHNGNLTKDLNKGIASITYNSLNLPKKITYSNGGSTTYIYGADGKKYRTVHVMDGVTTTTEYIGSLVYVNDTGKMMLTEVGYMDLTDNSYHYYLKDHQGNNRVVINGNGNVEEVNHYYPFGGVFSTSSNVQPYKYNGKEYDSKNGLNWYDYGARHYDATLGRWFVVDPLSNNHYGVSPYSYCLDNPMKYIDPDGKDVRIAIKGNTITIKANIILTGPKATNQLANIYQDDLMNNWGSMTSYEYKGNTYELNWDINVRVATKNEVENFNGLNNYMEVSSENSYVLNTQKGKIRNVGRQGIPFEFDNPMSHEFGHILGLKDKYQKGGTNPNEPVSPEWTGNIMAEEAGVGLVDKKNLDILSPKAIDSYLSFIQKNDFIPWLKYMSMYYFINQNNRE